MRCNGITKQGNRCKKNVKNELYCPLHNPAVHFKLKHDNNNNQETIAIRLARLIAIGTGLITIAEKAAQYIPDAIKFLTSIVTGSLFIDHRKKTNSLEKHQMIPLHSANTISINKTMHLSKQTVKISKTLQVSIKHLIKEGQANDKDILLMEKIINEVKKSLIKDLKVDENYLSDINLVRLSREKVIE